MLHTARPGVLWRLELGRLRSHIHLQGQEDSKVRVGKIVIFNKGFKPIFDYKIQSGSTDIRFYLVGEGWTNLF